MKNLYFALLSGFLFAISWPTYGFPLFLFVAFVPLLWNEFQLRNTHNSHWKVLGYSYITFFIFNLTTTWWLFYATPFGMSFAVLANSLLMSLVVLIYHKIAKKIDQKSSWIVLVCLWLGFEKFHLHWELSWPWLNLGNGFASYYKWVQWYEYTGTFGGTLWIWIVNIIVVKAIINYQIGKDIKVLTSKIIGAASIICVGIFSSLYMYYSIPALEANLDVAVLQPNVDPYTEKYQTANLKMAEDLIALTATEIDSTLSIVIAPETTLPQARYINNFKSTPEFGLLKDYFDQYPSTSFLSGITFIKAFPENQTPNATANYFRNSNRWYNSYNSSFFINKEENFRYYHKSKLVVGVEHIPYRSVLNPLLKNSMIDLGGSVSTLSTQKERYIFPCSKNTVAPIICYESVYGAYVTEYVQKGADFLAIITNDAWWNVSQGHKQHLSIARLRAIENRRGIARSANTGISALIDEKGNILKSIPYGEKGILRGKIPQNTAQTYYTTNGDYIFRVAMFTLILILFTSFTRRKQS